MFSLKVNPWRRVFLGLFCLYNKNQPEPLQLKRNHFHLIFFSLGVCTSAEPKICFLFQNHDFFLVESNLLVRCVYARHKTEQGVVHRGIHYGNLLHPHAPHRLAHFGETGIHVSCGSTSATTTSSCCSSSSSCQYSSRWRRGATAAAASSTQYPCQW